MRTTRQIHFVDADTGQRLRPDYDMGDIIKGTITIDPDGYPLLYAGSRDPRFRILALDGDEVREVWSLHAKSVEGMWNDDWDSNPVVIDDMLYVGGENSWWFAIKLNRSYDADGIGHRRSGSRLPDACVDGRVVRPPRSPTLGGELDGDLRAEGLLRDERRPRRGRRHLRCRERQR